MISRGPCGGDLLLRYFLLATSCLLLPALGVDAALLGGVGYAVDGQHVGGDAVVDAVGVA